MRAVVQRVRRAAVHVGQETVGAIEQGLAVLVGVSVADGPAQADALAGKIAHLRIFDDDAGRLNRSVLDAGGAVLVVSQFTLYADTRRGNRPGFSEAAAPDEGKRLYEQFCDLLVEQGLHVETGVFQAHMQVHLVNDGPVTILLDSSERQRPTRG